MYEIAENSWFFYSFDENQIVQNEYRSLNKNIGIVHHQNVLATCRLS